MVNSLKEQFLALWNQYFPGAALPIVFGYTDDEGPTSETGPNARCIICDLASVREGNTQVYNNRTIRCGGARRYLGYATEISPTFAHFLSCGIPGELEGERYKQSPELVERYLESQPSFEAPARAIVFKRWDRLEESDAPAAVIFFAPPDVLSGLFTLANFDEVGAHGVVAPFGSGCSSIVYHPFRELHSRHPQAVLGMFDVSARPCVEKGILTFSVPWPKFVKMVEHMEESFLITGSWEKVRARI